MEFTPNEIVYRDDDDLCEEYCNRVGCHACEGTVGESNEPNGYGCDDQDAWFAKHADLVAAPEMSDDEWATLAKEGEHARPDLFKRTEWEDEHPDDYDGPCLCRECLSYGE